MSKNSMPSEKENSKVVAGAAGAGGGTLLVLLANNLPEASPIKPWLVIIAPSASVFLGGTFFWFKKKIEARFQKKDLQAAIEDAKVTLREALGNGATSDEHKKTLREELEKLEKLAVAAQMQRVEALVR